jgi:hypothetical protein
MKKTVLGLLSILVLLATTTSCKKDEENKTMPIDPDNFQGEISSIETLDASKTYKLTGFLEVVDGGQLIIPAGTLIEGIGGTSAAIVVAQGGKIFVNGTKENPVVMTSGLAVKQRGDWGGLVICGKAPCNSGGGISEVGDRPYGGNIANDNSGTIRYLRIEYSGAAFNSEKEYNGLSLFGVGSGTTIEYVQVHQNADDGFEFYGGNVNANYMVSSHIEDDMFDWTEGWSGQGNYWFGKNDQGYGNRGFEGDNWETNNSATPYSSPILKNITLIGSGDQGPEPQGMELRRGTKGDFDNVVLKNWKIGIRVSGDISQGFLNNGLKVTNVKFVDCATETSIGTGNAAGITTNSEAIGAGAGANVPDWAKGWTIGLE